MDGRDPQPIARSPARDIRPQWSPDGRRIAFVSARGGNLDLYVMDTDGMNLRRITNHPDRDDFPTWHPDGKRLVYVAERDGRSDLWLLEVP